MVTIRELAEFRSARFTPILSEKAQVNPARYGAELAFWLCTQLAMKYRIETSYPVAEYWGWLLSYVSSTGDTFSIQCGNVDDTNDRWLLSIGAHGRKLFGRGKPDFRDARPLLEAIKQLLESEEDIEDLNWRFATEDV